MRNETSLSSCQATTLKYNLANGYTARFGILSQERDSEEAVAAIQRAKVLLQSLLIDKREVSADLLPRVVCNYAKVLSKLERNVEAIDQYIILLRRYPEHAVAMANCGIAIKSLRFLSGGHTHRNVYEAWKHLSSACELEEKVLEFASIQALEWFKGHLRELEEEIEKNIDGGLRALQEWSLHRKEVHGQPKAPPWLITVNQERLLLTTNQNPLNSLDECKDDLFFDGLITEGGDAGITRFTTLKITSSALPVDP
jgi:tetratricopeptide (TPR) repeat protein